MKKLNVNTDFIVVQLDELLPQTQCSKCGYPGCRPYAEAIAAGEAINHCAPGGQDTINKIAGLLGVEPLPLDSNYGVESSIKRVAYIREAECIGCTKCIQACPVDAIIGAAKHTHTVIVDECTGCDLCLEPCPVDCIDMIPVAHIEPQETKLKADRARERFQRRNQRLVQEAANKEARQRARIEAAAKTTAEVSAVPVAAKADSKSLTIAAALARTNLKKAQKRLLAAQSAGQDTAELEAETARLQDEVSQVQAALQARQQQSSIS